MCSRTSEEALPNESLAQKKLNVLLGPVARGQRLQKHQYFLKIHLHQLIRPFDQERRANIEVKLGKSVFFGLDRAVSRYDSKVQQEKLTI